MPRDKTKPSLWSGDRRRLVIKRSLAIGTRDKYFLQKPTQKLKNRKQPTTTTTSIPFLSFLVQISLRNTFTTSFIMEHPSFTLSALILAGGTMGYVKKGSIPSLAAGITFSAIFGTAGYLLKQNADYGLELALGGSSLLFIAGLARGVPVAFKKPVPVILTVLGGLGSAYYAKKYNEFYPIF